MKFILLNQSARDSIDEVVKLFRISELVDLDKAEMGNRISELVDLTGQDGQQFVHYVYTSSVETNPIAEMHPEQWLLCSFLATTFKGVLRKSGYDDIDSFDRDELIELSLDVIEKIKNE